MFPFSTHRWLICTCEEVVIQVLPWRRGVVRIEGEHEFIVELLKVGRERRGRKKKKRDEVKHLLD